MYHKFPKQQEFRDNIHEKVMGPHKAVQVVMTRGLFSTWRQSVYYDFDAPMTESRLKQIIISLESSGYSSTVHLLLILMTSRQIHVFADAPYLLKHVQNYFLNKGFDLSAGQKIDTCTIQQLLDKSTLDLSSQNYSTPSRHLQNTTSKSKDCGKTAIQKCWQGTGILRRVEFGGRKLEANIKAVIELMMNMSVAGCKLALPFQNGVLMSYNSLVQLFKDLKSRFDFTYILTATLNQNILEKCFTSIRWIGCTNDHPSPPSFMYRIRSYILSKHSSAFLAVNKNTDLRDDQGFVPNGSEVIEKDSKCIAVTDIDLDDELQKLTDVLENDERFVAHRFRSTCPGLGVTTNISCDVSKKNSCIQNISRGGLMIPNDKSLQTIKRAEKYAEVTDIVLGHCSDFPREVVSYFIKTCTYIRIKEINKNYNRRSATEILEVIQRKLHIVNYESQDQAEHGLSFQITTVKKCAVVHQM
ncbi:hypothetical protein PR048_022994 [Dryococelus australis]|uniref:Transposable element P transposase n=1 Tax=Dryococelus australis TaxID=614101 RepID=A0ABQ9GSX2_9NEOP|nr:hypothetical protein PR048_022994 [Dryococelus australis]